MDFLKPHSLIFCSKLVDLTIAISTELEKLDLEFEHSIVLYLGESGSIYRRFFNWHQKDELGVCRKESLFSPR